MKKIIAILLTFILLLSLCGCQIEEEDTLHDYEHSKDANANKNRQMYSEINLSDYAEVNNYKGIVVDTKSSSFSIYRESIISDDVYDNDLYHYYDSENSSDANAVVKDADIINLDYEGKIDGVAFSGGTSQGANLEIGSHTFIDDFEEQLIGAKVGKTRDVYVTFPTDYHSAELAGKEAVFTCKINYIIRIYTLEESYAKLGFESLEAYNNDINKRAAKNYLYECVMNNKTIKKYPVKDKENLGAAIISHITAIYAKSGTSLEAALSNSGMTVEQYKEKATTEMLNSSMIMYYILDKENLEIEKSALDSQDSELPAELQEIYAVQDIVMEFLYDNAIIK